MAYALKYYHDYCDTTNGDNCRLTIEQWDWDGAASEIECGPIPFRIAKNGSNLLKVGSIDPTQALVIVQQSPALDFEEFWTAFEQEYRITHTVNGNVDWMGFAIPNGFRYDMDAVVKSMEIACSDGLARLQGILFEESPGVNYTAPFEQSFLWVAKEALKKTGILLPIWTMVDIKPALETFTAPVRIAINVDTNVITLIDSIKNVKNNIQNGHKLIVTSGVGVNTINITIDSFTVVPGFNRDTIYVTPLEELPGASETGDAVIEIVPNVTDPSATYSDPLAITIHDIRVYIRDQDVEGMNYFEVNGGALTTWDVLNNLAKQWNVRIHQNNGRWELERINAHKVDAGVYSYFVYNSEGVEIGREPFGYDILLPCEPTRDKYQPLGHPVQMDRVFGFVGVNYVFKFKTDGDSLINLIRNGNFERPTTYVDTLAAYTPRDWRRWQSTSNGKKFTFGLRTYVYPDLSVTFPPGISTFLHMQQPFHYQSVLSSDSGYDTSVSQGDELRIEWFQRTRRVSQGIGFGVSFYAGVAMRVILLTGSGPLDRYYLVNSGEENSPLAGVSGTKSFGQWVKHAFQQEDWAFVNNLWAEDPNNPISQYGLWTNPKVETAPCPASGRLVIEILGQGYSAGFPPFNDTYGNHFFSAYQPVGGSPSEPSYGGSPGNFRFVQAYFHISGLFVAKIVSQSSEQTSQIHPYWYQNDLQYTDKIEDIEVLTGDDDNPDHVSNIYVLNNGDLKAIKSWDTWASDFGWGALGLITAKSVMEQYFRPWRLVYGDFVSEGIDWAKRVHFEERPGERYILLNGTIDRKNRRFSGLLAQVYDQSTPPLPGGGNDGGNTTDPNWQPTGIIRCVKDENGLNTGDQERQEVDMNPASTTQGQIRWVNIGENTEACPIGDPVDLYWGASTLPIDPATLDYFPYENNGNDYLVRFDNDGTGKYLVFLHRASLGTVNSIRYLNGGWQAYGNLPSWQYEADTTINGYTYKVMRQIYMSGTLNQLPLIFTIQ